MASFSQILLVAAFGMLATACGSAPSPSPSTSPIAPPVASPAAPSPIASSTTSASSAGPGSPSTGHDATDLEALLPATFRAQPLERDSLAGANALGADATSNVIAAFLGANGRGPEDVAVAQASDPSGTFDVTFVAFRVHGASGASLERAVVEATKAADPELVLSGAVIGGRTVITAVSPNRIRYLYVHNDVVLGVSGGTQAIVDEAIALMP